MDHHLLVGAAAIVVAGLAPPHLSAQQLRLDGVPVLGPLELPRESPAAPDDGPVPPAAADIGAQRRWSAPRLALGAAVAAAGVWYALSERRCRLHGGLDRFRPSPFALGTLSVRPSQAPGALAGLQIAYGGADNPVTAWTGSGCSLDWDYMSEEFWSARVGDRALGPTSYADVDPDAVRRWSTTDSEAQGDHQPAPPEALTAMRGTIETEDYLPPSRLYSGLGIAVAGAVVALFFSRVDVPDWVDVDVAPERASLSFHLGF